MENFGILPNGKVDGAYVWKHKTLYDAQCAAKDMAEKYHIEVVVFKIIGTYKPTVLWVAESEGS